MIHTHETAALSLGVSRHDIDAIKADPHKVDWPGLFQKYGPVVVQILLGLLGGTGATPSP